MESTLSGNTDGMHMPLVTLSEEPNCKHGSFMDNVTFVLASDE